MTKKRSCPIGIFDSGVGGLTVFGAIQKLLPKESLFYFGDTARVPYGNKGQEIVTTYAQEISSFLINHKVKALVIACNTASAYALDTLRQQFSIPIIGMIGPGAKKAASITHTKHIGVIGTKATIRSNVYQTTLEALLPHAKITSLACPLFVPLVEEGMLHHPITDMIAEEYLAPFKTDGVDTLLLGCTHYPHLKNVIEKKMGQEVHLVDSATCCAEELRFLLDDQGMDNNDSQNSPKHRFFFTDTSEGFQHAANTFLSGENLEIERVHL